MFRRDLAAHLLILSGVILSFAALWSVRDAIADELFAMAAEWPR